MASTKLSTLPNYSPLVDKLQYLTRPWREWLQKNIRVLISQVWATASGQSLTNGAVTALTGWTEGADTGNNFNPTTGVFTAPLPGFYSVTAYWTPNSVIPAASYVIIYLLVNGAISAQINANGGGPAGSPTVQVNWTASINAGDTISISAFQNTGGTIGVTDARLSIIQVG